MNQEQLLERDLSILGSAYNYLDIQYGTIKKYVGRRVLEIGAGIGNQIVRISEKKPDLIMAIEKNPIFCDVLKAKFGDRVEVVCGNIETICDNENVFSGKNLDTIIAMNILEHIEKDEDCIRKLSRHLESRGRIILVNPAFKVLYSKLDQQYGHYRRYSKKAMEKYALNLKMAMIENRYFNLAGWFGWLIFAKIGRCSCINRRSMALFNSVLKMLDKIESKIKPPMGLSLLTVLAKK
jgi:ubiquinone/menaquinone biosynthesis C-methylase UbiE